MFDGLWDLLSNDGLLSLPGPPPFTPLLCKRGSSLTLLSDVRDVFLSRNLSTMMGGLISVESRYFKSPSIEGRLQ
jgi:hypothetical protein